MIELFIGLMVGCIIGVEYKLGNEEVRETKETITIVCEKGENHCYKTEGN